ncbi:hypothetical protein K9M74_05565 [Candidatus Woesearchaeota archaeon]|nr:hypothetical protein [Candidatus Woesearchaeota archaeon]
MAIYKRKAYKDEILRMEYMNKLLSTIIILGLFAILLPGAVAVSEAKVSGWYSYYETFNFNDHEYSVRLMSGEFRPTDDEHNQNGGTLRIGKDDDKVIISIGTCDVNENRSYCFLNKSFEKDNILIDDQGALQPAIHIQIMEYDYSSKVDVTRTFEKTKFSLYEIGTVEITVQNSGDYPITNARITEEIPEGFEIEWHESTFFQSANNKLQSTFNLYPNKVWSAKYKIKGISYNTKESYTTQLMYDSEDGTDIKKSSSSATIEVLEPYIMQTTLPTTIKRDQPTEFEFKITNNENEELTVNNLRIYVPLSLFIRGQSNLNTYAFNTLGTTTTLQPKETKRFTIRIGTPFVGNFGIMYEGDLSVKDKAYEFSGTKNITVETDGLNCYFSFNEPTIQAGRKLQFTANLKNVGDLDDYYAINGTIHTAFEDIPFTIPNIFREGAKIIHNQRYQMPFSTKDKEYPFTITATYQTEAGQKFTCKEENNYLVKGAENILGFDIFVSADKPAPGDDINLVITASNEITEDIYDIKLETTSEDAEIIQGIQKKKINYLGSETKEEMYSLTIHIPEAYQKEKIEVITTGIVDSHNYTDSITTSIPIQLPTQDDNEVADEIKDDAVEETTRNSTTAKSNSKNTDTNEEEAPEGFLAKLWDFIKKLW